MAASEALDDNSYDGTAVQLVPQNVEKLPLFHWRPGARLLSLGSRDGVAFDGALDPAEARTFRRELSVELIAQSHRALGTDGLVTTWSESLRYPRSLDLVLATGIQPLVVGTAGHGPATQLDRLLAEAAAWLLFVGPRSAPHAARILAAGRHVEVVLGLADAAVELPALPWDAAVAVHCTPVRQGATSGEELAAWEDRARAALPSGVPVYDSRHTHTRCPACAQTLIWRRGGRSRVDETACERAGADGARCRACGATITLV